jgi:NAD(P) transhydrogenase subunit alpha
MKPGSEIVDRAVERCGNVDIAMAFAVAVVLGVYIVGHLIVRGGLPATASSLYAKNLFAFLDLFIKDKALNPPWDDEIVKATLLTRDGAVVHPNFQKGAK